MSESFDAVVVGSGPNGLVAANLLADRGWSVVVLEEQPEPGGAVKSAEMMEPGFVNDMFSAFYPLAMISPAIRSLELERYGLRWCHAPAVLAHPTLDGTCALLSRDIDETAASLDRSHRGDGDTWRAMFDRWATLKPRVVDALFGPFPPFRAGARLAWAVRHELLDALRLPLLSVRELGDEAFGGDAARRLLAGAALHADLTLDSPLGAVYGLLLCLTGQDGGYPVPQGGAGRLVDALTQRLRAKGATLRVGTRVDRVLVRDGRVYAVRTSTGEELLARTVLADVDVVALYERLVDGVSPSLRVRRAVKRFRRDPATVKVDWNLDAPIPWGSPEARRAGTVHVAEGLGALDAFTGDLAAGRLPRHPFLLVGQQSMADPTRMPSGCETVWAYTHVPSSTVFDSREVLEEFADRMQGEIEALAPGFGSLVRGRHVMGPLDLEARDANLVGGGIGGGSAVISQQLLFKPTVFGGAATTIGGLYLASASAHPGPGVHGVCGANAARLAVRSAKLRRR
ncbi:MAG: phytoene desaturase family protein [Acidimicrobiia bacterium]